MPVRVVCPECGATTSLPDESSKATVDCRQCGKELPVPGAKSGGPPPLPRKSGPPELPKPDAGFELLADDDENLVLARSRLEGEDLSDDTPRPGTIRDRDGAEDEDSGERSRRQAARARLRGEEPDEDDDTPFNDRERPSGSSNGKLFLVLALLAFLFVGGGGLAIGYYFWVKTGPVVAQGDNLPSPNGNPVVIPDPREVPGPAGVNPKPIEPKPKFTKPKETPPIEPKLKQPINPKPKDTKPIDLKPKDPSAPAFAVGATLVNPAKTKLPIEAAVMSAAHVEIALPGPIKDVCIGGGGRLLILHIPSARKLAIFDTSTLKVVKTLTLSADEVLFAAGMNKLMVLYPDERLVTRWDLATFKLEVDVILSTVQKPTALAMGSATDGPLVVAGIPAQGSAAKLGLTFLDQATLAEVRVDKVEGEFKVVFFSPAHLRMSADGNTIGAWYAQLQPTGLQIVQLQGNAISGSYLAESVGHVTPIPNGQSVGTEKGVFDTKAQPRGERKCMIPAIQGLGYLELTGATGTKQDVNAWLAGSVKPETFGDLPGFDGKRDPFERDNPNLTLDKRLFLVPDAKVLVVIPPAANKLLVYRVK